MGFGEVEICLLYKETHAGIDGCVQVDVFVQHLGIHNNLCNFLSLFLA